MLLLWYTAGTVQFLLYFTSVYPRAQQTSSTKCCNCCCI